MTATVPSQTEGFVRTQATSINARIEARPITLAPVTVFGEDDFPPLAATEAAISALIASRGDTVIDTTNYPDNDNMDEHEEDDELDDDGSYTSYDVKSTMSASTAGQSIVTFSQVAQRQAYDTVIDTTNYPDDDHMDEHEEDDELDDDGSYTSYNVQSTMLASTAGQSIVTFSQVAQRQAYDVSAEADVIMHHSDCEEEEMQYPTTSLIAKSEKKTKKAKKRLQQRQ
jgi:hypothetical protein